MCGKAQKHHAADFTFAVEKSGQGLKVGDKTHFLVTVKPVSGWHVYSAIASEEGAYSPTELTYEISSQGFEAAEGLAEKGSLHQEMDDVMGGMIRYYADPVVFSQEITITEGKIRVVGTVDYMACDDLKCVMLTEDFDITAEAEE